MGIDFSHCDAHWAYSGFNRFRSRLASAVGIDWEEIFESKNIKTLLKCKDPIIGLLNHSDCDGDLSPLQCRVISPRLKEIVSPWPDEDYDKQQALELVKGMELAAKKKERFIFT